MPKKNLVVGLFVIAALALLTVGLFMIGNSHEVFARHVDFYTDFTTVSGLAKGSKVQVAGMNAGQITDILIPASPASKFKVRFRIEESLHGLVRTDSVATIGTEGVVGDTFLSVSPGSAKAQAAPALSTLLSKEPTQLSDLLDQAKGTLGDVDIAVQNANGLLTSVGGNLNTTLRGATTTLGNVNDVVVGIKDGRGPVGMLLHDETVAGGLRDTVSNAQQASIHINHATAQADALVTDIEGRSLPTKIDGTLTQVNEVVANLAASSKDLRKTISDATAPDVRGNSAGENLQESFSNLNEATGNLAQDTEAIKHNFFFRPFFRRRGYYNLVHLSPDEYRKNALVRNSHDYRMWFSAQPMFKADGHGDEQLTAEGKLQIDQVVNQHTDRVVESPVMIEGYSDEHSAKQLGIARKRSLLVRNYLVMQYQLDPANVGMVTLQDHPPLGLGHDTWNGVSVVILSANK
jgi:phospholipid/cholesterol/gamma-HCH transport system substrate-binding protein